MTEKKSWKEYKKVYICSPFAGNVERNKYYAKLMSQAAYNAGYIPICVHLFLDEITGLSDENGNREELLELGRVFLEMCDELWLNSSKISEGMEEEVRHAKTLNIPIRVFKGVYE